MSPRRACANCLRRSWLLARLAGHLDAVRDRIWEVLGLPDEQLVAAVGGRRQGALLAELDTVDEEALAERVLAAELEAICICDPSYPSRLRACSSAPAVLYVAGGLERFLELLGHDPVAVVGARRASDYGLEAARVLAHGLACAGVTVLSGMALGVDSAAHAGALGVGEGPTVAVLPGGAERSYPPSKRALYKRIRAAGAVVSELPPGAAVWRWSFPARNRTIAALGAMTVVVEGRERSGSLITARLARELGRPVGAVPGRVTSPLAAGPNGLLAGGAATIRGPQDVLDALFGAGVREPSLGARPALPGELEQVLSAIGEGHDTVAALGRAGVLPGQALAALSALELTGYVRREAGGRYLVVP
jgi:DNA processing protein